MRLPAAFGAACSAPSSVTVVAGDSGGFTDPEGCAPEPEAAVAGASAESATVLLPTGSGFEQPIATKASDSRLLALPAGMAGTCHARAGFCKNLEVVPEPSGST